MRRWRDPYAKSVRSLQALAREASGKKKPPSDRERLAARLTLVARALGADTEFAPKDIERVHAGRWQRSEGAWSWGTMGALALGSQHPMKACARGPVVVSARHGQYSLSPVTPDCGLTAPAGGMIGLDDSDGGEVEWYDAEGHPLRPPQQP